MTPSPALVRALAGARPRLNAAVAAAKAGRSGFDLAALTDAVQVRLDPLATAVEAIAPDRTQAVVEAGFTLSVTLVGQGLSGARRLWVDRSWAEAGVALAAIVAERPQPVLAALANGVLTLAGTPGARPEGWLRTMAALAPLATADTLLAAGQVAAWRAGLAHFREAAIALADTLPEPLALAAMEANGTWGEVRAALLADRWWMPDGSAAQPVRVGGFTGFGGPFAEPPEVRAGTAGFVVRAAGRHRLLVADAFGATLHAADADAFDAAAPPTSAEAATTRLPPYRLTKTVCDGSVAYASPYSHYLEVGPWRP